MSEENSPETDEKEAPQASPTVPALPPDPIPDFIIPGQLATDILNFLADRPYREVYPLIEGLRAAQPVERAEQATPAPNREARRARPRKPRGK